MLGTNSNSCTSSRLSANVALRAVPSSALSNCCCAACEYDVGDCCCSCGWECCCNCDWLEFAIPVPCCEAGR
eukprot:10907014-Ditylum_brightwellii.AAC.1